MFFGILTFINILLEKVFLQQEPTPQENWEAEIKDQRTFIIPINDNTTRLYKTL